MASVKTPVGTDLDQVACEFVFENPVPVAAEINQVAQSERVEIRAARVFPIKPHAAVALNAAVHLVIQERPEVLIAERPLSETGSGDSRARS